MAVDLSLSTLALGAALILAVALALRPRRARFAAPLPPAPKTSIPLIGHTLMMSGVKYAWVSLFDIWKSMGEEACRSGIMYMRLGNGPNADTIIVNTCKATQDLLEKKSGLYSGKFSPKTLAKALPACGNCRTPCSARTSGGSVLSAFEEDLGPTFAWRACNDVTRITDRPRMIVPQEYISNNRRMVLTRYNDRWRQLRKFLHTQLHDKLASTYEPVQGESKAEPAHGGLVPARAERRAVLAEQLAHQLLLPLPQIWKPRLSLSPSSRIPITLPITSNSSPPT